MQSSNSKQHSGGWLAQEQEFVDIFFNQRGSKALAGVKESEICTPESCMRFASKTLETDGLHLVDNQGAVSYTLISTAKG